MPTIIVMFGKIIKKVPLKRIIVVFVALILISLNPTVKVNAATENIYLGGYAAGFTITTKGAEVLGLSEVVTESGVVSPAKDAEIFENDLILNISGIDTNTLEDLEKVLDNCAGKTLIVTIKRGNEIIKKEITPVKDLSGKYKLGLYIRDKLSGIGTITFIKENGVVMALGHPVCNENNNVLEIVGGELYKCSIYGVEKGERGKAGELRGMFISDNKIGSICKNLPVGISGIIDKSYDLSSLKKIQTGEAHSGSATIWTTIDGVTPSEYDVSIIKVDKHSKDNRNFVIKVTDKNLIEESGGIVQGMSGSPIVQDNKIVGAITHVFLNDPTRGFGISISNMMN